MQRADAPAVLVARFLRSNNYEETLRIFLEEAGLPDDTGGVVTDFLTIEQILQEKRVFDVSRSFEKTGLEDGDSGWSLPAPSSPTIVDSLPASSNLLHASLETVGDDDERTKTMIVSAADKSLHLLDPAPPFDVRPTSLEPSDSPILSCSLLAKRYLVTTSMSGTIVLHDLKSGEKLDQRRDHLKYVVKAATYESETGDTWIATAAWDSKVCVYHLNDRPSGKYLLGEPLAAMKLPSNPESILFITHPEISSPVLLVGRRDSTFLYYYALPERTSLPPDEPPQPLLYLGKQNLAPNSNAWVAFNPSDMALSPRDPSLLAVATSAVPHMKLIIVRLLPPPPPRANSTPAPTDHPSLTQTAQASTALALQDREAAAILIHVTTFAPQTAYSTPALAWRPDGSGVFVNGDDGVVRALEASTGKVVATLKGGHEAGSKVRCLWAGWAAEEGEDEVVLSGGFDRRLVVWKVAG